MTSVLRAAERYVRRGFAVVPVPAGRKRPVLDEWQNLRLTLDELPDHFNGQPRNVGLILGPPSGWLANVDLDVPEAVMVAGRFLPPTLTSGHGDALDLHWWYFAEGIATKDFRDTDGKTMLVELRAGGRQTLVAPSTHPDGDTYTWRKNGLDIAEVSATELRAAVNKLATATLIAVHLPEHRKLGGGGRHDFALSLAGYMLRNERLDKETVLAILLAAWDVRGWPSEQDRREAYKDLEGAVEDTARKLGQGKKVKGGGTLESMEPGLPARIADYWDWADGEREEDEGEEEKEERRNQADRLIGYALADTSALFLDQHGAPHALVNGEPVPLNSRCYSWLRRLMWEAEQRAVNSEYLKTAAGTLAAHAEFSGDVRELHTRGAWHGGALFYELRPGRVVKVSAGGWDFEPNPPVLFRRFPNLKPLPDPEEGGSLVALDGLVNLKTERGRRLFKAYFVTLPLPHVGRPILNAAGAMGSGKTTIGRILKRAWDPTAPETVRFDPRDFLQKATHSYVLMLDNQSSVPEWAADILCRLVTGEADSKRKLYTDDEDVIIELKRAVLLNGINVPTDRGDVLDRSLVVELERIPDGERKTEEELCEEFEREHPKLLGAAFDVLARAIAAKPSLELSRRPRLADWGEYAAAVYKVVGWGAGRFLEDWDAVVKVQNQATLDGSPVAQAIIKFMEDKEEHAATSSELYKKLQSVAESLGVSITRDKAWPKSARWLWRRIKEVLPVLAAVGIEASRREDKTGTLITLRKPPKDDATNATEDEKPIDKPDSDGVKDESVTTSNATEAESNATGGNSEDSNTTTNATGKADTYPDSGDGGISGIRYYGDFSGSPSSVVGGDDWRDHPLSCECDECLYGEGP